MLASLLMSGLLSRRQVAHMAASWPSMRALAPRGGNPLWGDPLSAPDDPSGQRGYGYPPWQPPDLPAAAFCLHQHWHNLDTCWLVHHAKPLWLAFRCCTLLPCRLTLMHTLVCMYILHLVRLLKSQRWCRAMVTVGPPTRSFFPSIILRTLCWRHLWSALRLHHRWLSPGPARQAPQLGSSTAHASLKFADIDAIAKATSSLACAHAEVLPPCCTPCGYLTACRFLQGSSRTWLPGQHSHAK